LTAWTRVTLARQLRIGSPVYADTDSCYSEQKRQASDKLGQWKFEGNYQDFQALAPKAYRYKKDDGTWHVRCKGVPGMSAYEFDSFANGETITRVKGVLGIKSAARSGVLFQKKVLKRTNRGSKTLFGSRELSEDGSTYPLPYSKLVKLWL
jgi:hypothetical protein